MSDLIEKIRLWFAELMAKLGLSGAQDKAEDTVNDTADTVEDNVPGWPGSGDDQDQRPDGPDARNER